VPCQQVIGDGHDEQGKQDGGKHAGKDDGTNDDAGLGTRPGGEQQRDRARRGSNTSHDDRAQADVSGLQQRLAESASLIPKLIGELDDENPVLRRQPNQHDQPDFAVDIHTLAGEPQTDQGAGHRQRDCEHDDKGVDPAFELSREHQEDDSDAKGEDEQDAGGAKVSGLAFVVHLGAIREMISYQALQIIEGVIQDETVGQVGLDGDGADAVVAVEASRIGNFGDPDQIGERDQLSVARRSASATRARASSSKACSSALVISTKISPASTRWPSSK
jgi:hypothetical protein